MNKVYKTVWNKARGQLIAVSEAASTDHGGATAHVGATVLSRVMPLKVLVASIAVAWLAAPMGSAFAAPLDGLSALDVATGSLAADSELLAGATPAATPDDQDESSTTPALAASDPTTQKTNAASMAFAPLAITPMAAPVQTPFPPAVQGNPSAPPGLVIGTGGILGATTGALNPTTTALLGSGKDPNGSTLHAGNLSVAASNITQTYDVLNVIGIPLLTLNPVNNGVAQTLTGSNQNLTLLGGVSSGNYITGINYGLGTVGGNGSVGSGSNAIAGFLLPDGAPSWASSCGNLSVGGISAIDVKCWSVNAAQNNQVLIGDGASANGSEEVVIGTGASHTLPPVAADTLFGGDGTASTAGVPDANYQARLGHSVVVGDQASGTQNAQTILGAEAKSNQANSVALGYQSDANRGAVPAYTNAPGLVGTTQSSAGEVAVGSTGNERQITHVAPGQADTDAVNVAQLNGVLGTIAADDTHFYSVNSTDSTAGNYNNDGASAGINSMAAGVATTATGNNATAVGTQASATNTSATAIGAGAAAGGQTSVALGVVSSASQLNAIAVGNNAHADGQGALSVGYSSQVGGTSSGAFGASNNVAATVTNSFAIGNTNAVSSNNVFVLGSNVQVSNNLDGAVVLGNSSTAANNDNSTNGGKALYSDAAIPTGGAVSVGATNAERQIKNVAGGTAGTDAVNVAQLQSVADLADNAVQYDGASKDSVTFNPANAGTATKNADGTITTTGGTQLHNVASAGDITNAANALNGVNAGDLNNAVVGATNDLTNKGLQFGANAGGPVTNKLGSLVNVKGADANTDATKFDAGANLMTAVDQDTDGNSTIRVALAKDLAVDSVTTGDTVMNS